MTRKTRKATLRVSHQTTCAKRPIVKGKRVAGPSSEESLNGCTCAPSFFVMWRYVGLDGREKVGITERVRTLDEGKALLAEKQNDLYKGRDIVVAVDRVTFPEWCDEFEQTHLAAYNRESTRRAYTVSLNYARASFGQVDLRAIGHKALLGFVSDLREQGMSDRTVSKHLRHLSTCFTAAKVADKIPDNPIKRYQPGSVLQIEPVEANYFTDAELTKLWQQLRTGLPRLDKEGKPTGVVEPVEPVYLYLCQFAVTTGMRLGELLALDFADIRLSEGSHGEVKVTKSLNDRGKVGPPKTKSSRRDVHLTADARGVLEEWMRVLRVAKGSEALDDKAPVFPAERNGRVWQSNVSNRVLNPAMEAAKIPKANDYSPEERSFHTFRHCYARLMLEPPILAPLQWVSGELGHSSTAITEGIYGHWGKEARRATAASIAVGAFPVR